MAEKSQHHEACCTIPPVVSKGYQAKGKYIELDGVKTYATGPSDASKAVFYIPDIFGFTDQTLQGADIIAHSDKHTKYQVLIPDFFDGKPSDVTKYPPSTDEEKKDLNKFFERIAPPKQLPKIPALVKDAEKQNPNIKKWAVIGYCWGGKMTVLAVDQFDTFSAAAQCHPAFVDPEDAKKVKVPFLMLPSKDEDAETCEKFMDALTVPKKMERFPDQIHGWMAARADLSDPKVKAAYEKGYSTVVEFFHEQL